MSDSISKNAMINLFDKKNYVKFFIKVLALLLLLSPGFLNGQDLSPAEIEKYHEIRDSLIQEGFLSGSNDYINYQTANVESEIKKSWYTNQSLSVTTSGTRGTDFNHDGTRFYVVGRSTLNIVEYHLTIPWAIETATYVRELDISTEMGSATQLESVPHGIYIRKDDGKLMWIGNRTEIWEYTLSTPWDITSATPTGYRDLSNVILRGHDFDFKPDGRVLYYDDRFIESVFQFNLSVPWDISTVNLDYVFDISDQQQEVRGVQLDKDGKRMFLMDTERLEVLEYYISQPYDLRTAAYVDAFSVGSESTEPRGITFRSNSKMFYVTSSNEGVIHQYALYEVNSENSSVAINLNELEANGNDRSTITVTLRDEDMEPIPYIQVRLNANRGSSQIRNTQNITDNEGMAIFDVRNDTPEIITYRATALSNAGNIGIAERATVTFLPLSPVVLTATQVEEREFTANWEMVPVAANYLLDVSTDSTFNTFEPGFENLDVGFTTDLLITGLNPGTKYYYRVRAESNGLVGNNSMTMEVETFPDTPVASVATNIIATKFNARWQQAEGAQSYIVDVARDDEFTDLVPGYESLDVGNQLNYEIEGLFPGTTYYYRVRSGAHTRISENSNFMDASTLQIGIDLSEIESSQLRVLANGIQENIITFILRDSNGAVIQGEELVLIPDSGSSAIEALQNTTDEDGEVRFAITNTRAEVITYRIFIAESFEILSITAEFLQDEGVLSLGNNYPNPFNRNTTFPVTVPERMQIRIVITNLLGASIKTLVNEEFNTGYYEIPVDMSGLASGVYFYRLVTTDKIQTKNMLLVK